MSLEMMELIADYLESYEGRDKFLRTLSYTAKLLTAVPSEDAGKKLKFFGSQMSNCRVMLRLLDDIPSIYSLMSYGWGKQEPDECIRWLQLVEMVVDVIYSPIETVCWLGENQLVSIDVDKWDKVSTWFWIVSLYLSLMKAGRRHKQLTKKKDFNGDVKCLKVKILNEKLVCIRMILDLTYAISYLPKGTLWGGKLSTWQVGALGTLSSFIGLYQALNKRILQKKSH